MPSHAADPYFLVIVSSVLHAWWNFVYKRAGGGQIFMALSKVGEAVVFALPFAFVLRQGPALPSATWMLVGIGAALTALNYIFLGKAYASGDLATTYAVSRAGALMFLPIFAWLFSGETVSRTGIVGVLLIILGTVLLQVPKRAMTARAVIRNALSDPALVFALGAAFTTAAYTLWDRHAARSMPAFVYFYLYTAIIAAGYGIWLMRRPAGQVAEEWRRNRWPILQVAVCNTVAYYLVLVSLVSGNATYVIAVRQLSILFGALLGWKFLRESVGPARRLGIAALLGGCWMVVLA